MTQLLAVPTDCPKCGGKVWDNRLTKSNPKAPDFKCRDKSCDWVLWPPKKGELYADRVGNLAPAVQQVTQAVAPYEETLPVPARANRSALPTTGTGGTNGLSWLDGIFHLYAACAAEAEGYAADPAVKAQVTATLFIQACRHPQAAG